MPRPTGRSGVAESSLDRAFDEMFETIRAIQRFVEDNHARFLLILIPGRDAFAQGTVAEAPQRLFQLAVAKSVDLRIPHVDTYAYLEEAGGKDLFMDFCHPNRRGHERSHKRYTHFSRVRLCSSHKPPVYRPQSHLACLCPNPPALIES